MPQHAVGKRTRAAIRVAAQRVLCVSTKPQRLAAAGSAHSRAPAGRVQVNRRVDHMTCVAFARQPRASKPTVAKYDARYFDLTWFPTPDPGQHWAAARREQLAAIAANPDKARAAEAQRDGGRRGRRRRQSTGADYSSLSLATETSSPLRERFPLMLPPRPYCSNDPRNEGVRIRHRDIALRHRHIQLNGPNVVRFLSFDVDRNDAFFAAEDGNLPPPNFVAVNMQPGPREGHAHLGYLLADPVHKFAMSRRGPPD
jgi:Replicase family